MDLRNANESKRLVVIEYPGKVENPERMIDSLGGIEDLSRGFQKRQKLQLKFRQNFFAKPVLSSEPLEQSGMLLKVKVRRSKRHPDKKPEVVSTEVVGTVQNGYKFNSLCDFQYLPIQRNEKTGETENIYHDSVPEDINAGPSWFRDKADAHVFLPPYAFTRSDTMQPTILKNETKDGENDESAKFAITNRSSRTTNGISIPFHMSDPVPTKANEAVKDILASTLITQEDVEMVRNLFTERPIWTLASLRAHMRVQIRRLNFILASMAFYYSTGPWRNCFVLFGYDPRVDFESRHYQMLDFRVRASAGLKSEISSRRQAGVNRRVRVPAKYEGEIIKEDEIEANFQKLRKEAIFTPETIPPFRARQYQLIDVQIPKIQDMIRCMPAPLSGSTCNEKRGWLPVGFIEECRDMLSEIAQANMLKNISYDADEGSDSDDTDAKFPEDLDHNDDEDVDEQ